MMTNLIALVTLISMAAPATPPAVDDSKTATVRSLSKQEVDKVLASVSGTIRNCYQSHWSKTEVETELALKIRVDAVGSVVAFSDDSPFEAKTGPFVGCLNEKLGVQKIEMPEDSQGGFLTFKIALR